MTDLGAVIRTRDLGKAYELYARPHHRLMQTLLRGKRKFYREFWALQGVALDVERGECVAVIGRNGSGKSTLLQLLAGTLSPTTGSIEVRGRLSALLELGAGFDPEFTGRGNVYLATSLLGMSHAETVEKFDSIAAFADIGDFIEKPVKTYSSGMYVRLAFAVAVSIIPEVLVVDEALAVGDLFFQQKCIRHMKENLADATKILVTHDLHTVSNMADRALLLEKGEPMFLGSPKEAIERYVQVMHTDAFETNRQRTVFAAPTVEHSKRVWTTVNEEKRGGAQEVRVEAVALETQDGQPAETVSAGDALRVALRFAADAPKKHLVFGYIVNDRVGNAIFGENTLTSLAERFAVDVAGRYEATLDILWPEIRPDEYTLTLGIGEGTDPLHHIIQCWAHNVLKVTALSPDRVVHCIFNNRISACRLTSVA
jgi:ABC-type polysaccharide/polyol phosphate transport system ATPase subunit